MTYRQEVAIQKAKEKIREIEHLLYDVLYADEKLDDKTHYRIMTAYDRICEAKEELQ